MRRASLSRNTVIHLVGGVVAAGGNLLLAPVYLRLLSADDFGAWSRFLLAVQVMQPVFCWGLLATMTRLLADGDDDADRRARLLAAGLRLATLLNLLLLALLLVGLPAWQRWVVDATSARLVLFAAAAAALAAYPAMLMGVHMADNDALRYRGVSLMGFGLQVLVLAAAAMLVHLDAQGAATAMLLATGIYALVAVWRLWPQQAGARPGRADHRALLAFGVPVVLYTVSGQASDFLIRSLVAAQVSRAEFGAFSAGLLFASLIAMLSSAVNMAWVPLYYRKAQQWTESGVYSRFVELFAAASGLAAAFLIVFSDELLTAYSGGRVQLPVSTVAGLVIAAWLNTAVWMGLSNPLFQQQRTRTVLAVALAAAVMSAPLAWLFIRQLGVSGASWSLAANALLLCGLAAGVLHHLGLPTPAYRRLALVLLLLLLLSGPWLSGLYQQDAGWLRMAGKSLLMAGVAAISAALFLQRGLQVLKTIESDLAT